MEAERIGRFAAKLVKSAQAAGRNLAAEKPGPGQTRATPETPRVRDFVSKAVPTQEQTNKFARTAGMFTKHVVGATVKPIHSLWHEVIGFIFMAFAAIGAWKLYSNPGKLELPQFVIALIFVTVVALYGVSSILKSRRIAKKNSRP